MCARTVLKYEPYQLSSVLHIWLLPPLIVVIVTYSRDGEPSVKSMWLILGTWPARCVFRPNTCYLENSVLFLWTSNKMTLL
jgi:hypothetical protein